MLRSAIAGSHGKCMFHSLRNYQTIFQRGCTILHLGQQGIRYPVSLHSGQYLVLALFLIVLAGVLWYITLLLIYISLMASDFEHLFFLMFVLPSLYPFQWNALFCLLPIFSFYYLFFTVEFWEVFIYIRFESFVWYMVCKYFLPVCSLSLCLNRVCYRRKILILMRSSLSILLFMAPILGDLSESYCPRLRAWWFLSYVIF